MTGAFEDLKQPAKSEFEHVTLPVRPQAPCKRATAEGGS